MTNYIMAVVLLAVSIMFFKSNGNLMIPAVQNKTPQEIEEYKEQYDVKKMCKITGCVMLISSVLIAISGYLKKDFITYGIICIIIIMVVITYNIFRTGIKK